MKLGDFPQRRGLVAVSPGLTAGGGLKLLNRVVDGEPSVVSPGLTAGGGLKLRCGD